MRKVFTPEEQSLLSELSLNPDLNIYQAGFGNQYYGVDRVIYKHEIEILNTLLRRVIPGFVSFSNFTDQIPNRIRMQIVYSPMFQGVHYETLESIINAQSDEEEV